MALPLIPNFILQASFTNAYTQLLPLAILALLVDVMIIVIWYYIGVFLNNNAVKGSAKNEFYQFIGTCLMIAIIIAILVFASTAFYNVLGATKLMSPSVIQATCQGISTTSSLDIIGKTNSLLTGPTNGAGTGNFPGLCTLVSGTGTDITTKLDYPLSATAVIVANLTNQTAANLNYSFTEDAWIGFLASLQPQLNLCIDRPPDATPCLIPNPVLGPLFELRYTFTPYAGYNILLNNLATFGSLLNFSVQSFVGQMLIITIFLYIWPYLLFVGIILRCTFLTRKLGGLLIAIAVAALLVFPIVYSFEYLAVGNGIKQSVAIGTNLTGYNSTYGFNAITSLPGANNGNYMINFFVEPNIKTIANSLNCWPSGSSASALTYGKAIDPGLFTSEEADIFSMLLPGISIWNSFKAIYTTGVNGAPSITLPVNCVPSSALNTFYALLNAYGIIGVDSYLLPLMNLVILITAVTGLSGLFGGDTELAGLSKFV